MVQPLLNSYSFKHYHHRPIMLYRLLGIYLLALFTNSTLLSAPIQTFYGVFEVEEPVLLELIESPAFQRLKQIHQYGVAFYTTHSENYTRYDHSLGVFALLRQQACSLDEQIAGLLHDASHTAFSHVGDWIFHLENQEKDYQNLTHGDYLEKSGLGNILSKYGYSIDQIQPKQELFPALEQPLPALCADRLDYNLQGAYYRGFITKDEATQLFHDMRYADGDWFSHEPELMKKLVRFSLHMSEACWGSALNHMLSTWLAEALWLAVGNGLLTVEDIRFGVDQELWDLLLSSDQPKIQDCLYKIFHPSEFFCLVDHDEADFAVYSKFRGINPWVVINGQKVRLLSTDATLADEYASVREKMAQGWQIKITTPLFCQNN